MPKRTIDSTDHGTKRSCTTDSLYFGTLPYVQSAVEYSQLVAYPCFTALPKDDETPLEFRIDKTDAYVDLTKTFLQLKIQLLQQDGSVLPSDAVVAPINNIAYSMFDSVELLINDQKITTVDNCYPWVSYVYTLLYNSELVKKTVLRGSGWFQDQAGIFDTIAPADNDELANEGFTSRFDLFADGKKVNLYSKIFLTLNYNRLLPAQTEVSLKFNRRPSSFVLMAKEGNYKLRILEAKLFALRVSLSKQLTHSYDRLSAGRGLMYPATNIITRTKTISAGDQNFEWVSFSGKLPQRIYIWQIDQDAYNGVINKNPFNFKTFGMSKLQVYKNDICLPTTQGIEMEDDGRLKAYLSSIRLQSTVIVSSMPSAAIRGAATSTLVAGQWRQRGRRERRRLLRRERRLRQRARLRAGPTAPVVPNDRLGDPAQARLRAPVSRRRCINKPRTGQPRFVIYLVSGGSRMRFGGIRKSKPARVKVATVNVRSLRRDTAEKTQILKEMAVREHFYALALCETRISGSGELDLEDGWVLVYHNSVGIFRGVGVVLSPAAAEAWKAEGSKTEVDTEGRVLLVTQASSGGEGPWYIMVGYSPTARAVVQRVDTFFEALSAVLRAVSRRSFIWIGGDFNSRLGKRMPDEQDLADILGPYSVSDHRNHMGERFLLFCQAEGLRVSNGFFNNKVSQTATWYHPRWKYPATLDLSLVRVEHAAVVAKTVARPGLDIGSDHKLLSVELMQAGLDLPCRQAAAVRRQQAKRPKKINVAALRNQQVRDDYTAEVERKIQAETPDIERVAEIVRQVAESKLGFKPPGQKSWIAEKQTEIRALAQEKQDLFSIWKLTKRQRDKRRYRECCHKVRNRMREMENQWLRDKADQIDASWAARDSAAHFQQVADLAKEYPTGGLRYRKNRTDGLNLDGFRGHFSRILNVTRDVDYAVLAELPRFNTDVSWDRPSLDEVDKAFRALKSGKAEGLSGVPAECVKCVPGVVDVVQRFIADNWDNDGTVPALPASWLDAVVVALYKNKGDYGDMDNWRGIVLLEVLSKVVNIVLNWRLQAVGEQIWGEEQHGFRGNRGTADCIYSLRRMVEEFGLSVGDGEDRLYVLFVDLKKAFDSCDRQLIWELLKLCGIPDNVIAFVRAFHDSFGAMMQFMGDLSERFEISTGVRQGCCCGPTLWNFYFFFVMWLWRHRCVQQVPNFGVRVKYKKDLKIRTRAKQFQLKSNDRFSMQDLEYADDTAVFCRDSLAFQQCAEIMDSTISQFGGEISLSKTEWFCVPHADGQLQLRGEDLKQVQEFEYLGSTVGVLPDGHFGALSDTKLRVSKASAAFGKLRGVWRSSLLQKTKGRVFQACVAPVLLYGIEVKTLSSAEMQKLKFFWYGCLKSIKNLRWHTSFTDLLDEFGVEDVRVLIKKRTAGFMGHLARMDADRIPFKLAFGHAEDRAEAGTRGRIKTVDKWYNEVAGGLPGINKSTWPLQAQDRTSWRAAVKQAGSASAQDVQVGGAFACREAGCGLTFNTQLALDPFILDSLRIHVATVAPAGSSTCPHCNRVFKNEKGVKIHVARYCKAQAQVAIPPAGPAVPAPQVEDRGLFTVSMDGGVQMFQCRICGVTRRSHCTMSRHINSAHGESRNAEVRAQPAPVLPAAGPQGQTGFTADPDSANHVICNKCNRRLTKNNWARHDDRCRQPYRCGICQREFNRVDGYNRHVRICGRVSLTCPRCGRQDRFVSQAQRHQDRCRV